MKLVRLVVSESLKAEETSVQRQIVADYCRACGWLGRVLAFDDFVAGYCWGAAHAQSEPGQDDGNAFASAWSA